MNEPVISKTYSVFSKKTANRKLHIVYFLLFMLSCFMFLFGCSAKHPILSGTHQKAAEFNQNGGRAFQKGDFRKALFLYQEALKVNRSIEDHDGTAVSLINMASVYRSLGDTLNAHICADEILNSPGISYSLLRLTDAAFIKALLLADGGEYDAALIWADKSLSLCQTAGCTDGGSIHNLRAKIYLFKKEPASALVSGNKGLELNKTRNDTKETANSLRLIAEAKASLGQFDEAIRLYEDALATDKNLGLSRKVAFDLMGIGKVLHMQGKCEDAVKYFNRALSAGENGGDQQVVRDAGNMIDKCRKK
jgi:tetratricopeptide (TPR) repeat protein